VSLNHGSLSDLAWDPYLPECGWLQSVKHKQQLVWPMLPANNRSLCLFRGSTQLYNTVTEIGDSQRTTHYICSANVM
jgi:hypothetical protein